MAGNVLLKSKRTLWVVTLKHPIGLLQHPRLALGTNRLDVGKLAIHFFVGERLGL